MCVRFQLRPLPGHLARRHGLALWQVSWLAALALFAAFPDAGVQWLGSEKLAAYSCEGSHGVGP
ncbi:hypothetical protein XM25_07445 [Devosia sp. H5989]|nr:hypothetical protein XM25_07445 [Devosia sp. H5989]